MGGKNRQRKSSSLMSVFNIFKSNSRHRGYSNEDGYEEGTRARKVWPSDEDRGRWGVAEPGIDRRAAAFIAQYKKRVSDSEIHCQPQPH
ncbi:hypothetical protein G2W53_044130 [Senna tora]|uniref:Uncharacterized protein n=1 Tax=Senna tora TaxID=362788 RepID=A0A834SWV2_9FABA|nr:hypothetical protein G2W53_044130 [Senna tora]